MAIEFSFETPLILIGDGYVNTSFLETLPDWPVIALDGGVYAAHQNKRIPRFVVGDLDSSTTEDFPSIPRHYLEDQNKTDLHKTLEIINAPLVFVFGTMSPRLDHGYDSLLMPIRFRSLDLRIVGPCDIVRLIPPRTKISTQTKTRIGLITLDCGLEILDCRGLRWPISTLAPLAPSVSNYAVDTHIWLDYRGGDILLIEEII